MSKSRRHGKKFFRNCHICFCFFKIAFPIMFAFSVTVNSAQLEQLGTKKMFELYGISSQTMFFEWGNEGKIWESCTSYAYSNIIRVITVRVTRSLLYRRERKFDNSRMLIQMVDSCYGRLVMETAESFKKTAHRLFLPMLALLNT